MLLWSKSFVSLGGVGGHFSWNRPQETNLGYLLQGIMGSIEDGLNRIVEAITPRGLGGHGPRKVKVNTICWWCLCCLRFAVKTVFLRLVSWFN